MRVSMSYDRRDRTCVQFRGVWICVQDRDLFKPLKEHPYQL